MSESLRRSSRRTTKNATTYKVGDVVEIAKDDVVVKGRLVFKLNEGNTVNPRWLVSFDDDPSWKDEEVYEKSFLKLVTVDTENPGTAGKPQAPRRTKAARSKKSQKSSGSSTKGSSSSEAEESRGSARLTTNKRKVVTGSETSPAVSEIDSPVSKDEKNKMSAREQRSLRRQAKMKEDEPMIQPKVLAGTKRVRNLPAPNSKLSGSTSSQMPHKKKARKDDDAEVVKVPMLTGTLFLYRGANRRAEFVRRI